MQLTLDGVDKQDAIDKMFDEYHANCKLFDDPKTTDEEYNLIPLFEKGVRINDVILSINDETASWSNLTSSLKFATLGENLRMEILNQKNEIVSIDFDSYTEKSN